MNKFKRILSVILIAAMALSLMPTFASAEVGDTYTYLFNPKAVGNDATATEYAEDATFTYDYTMTKDDEENVTYYPWKYVAASGGGTIVTYLLGTTSYCMRVIGTTNKYWALALAVKIPESGTFKAELNSNLYKYSGSIDAYLLPAEISADNYSLPENIEEYEEYKLNTSEINLNSSSTAYNQTFEITTNQKIVAEKNDEERLLIFAAKTLVANSKATGQVNNIYINNLTLTKTADAEEGGDVIPPAKEEKKDPITLTFNKDTVTVGSEKVFNTFSANEGQNFGFVSEKSSSTSGSSSSIQTYGLLMNSLRAGGTGKNWLNANETSDPNAGRLTISANDIPAGMYKLSAGVHNFTRGSGVYYYVNDEYVGYDNAYAASGTYNDDVTTEETIGYITITDKDNNADTQNPVEISLCTAAVDYITNANLYVLRSITFTPVDEIPDYGELECTVDGTATKESYEIENGGTLSLSAMLSGKHLNGYKLDGEADNQNCIKVTSSNPTAVSVTDTEAALDRAKIYASDYKPVYTLTALKSNASATITVEAIVDGASVASKSFEVNVAKSDADAYEADAVFAWGTNLPSELSGNVTVSEKDGATVNAGEITASKGTTYTFKATEEITVGEITYKFIGWKRGTTSNGAAAFISYEPEDEYTVWSNTYITAVYEEVHSDEKRVEFYDQDGYFLGYMSETDFEDNGLPDTNPKLLGHTFSKWQYVENGETKDFTEETELTESVTRVVALQTPAEVTITYKSENDEVAATKTYSYDEEVNALSDSGLEGVKFWKLLVDNSEKTVRTNEGYSFYAWADSTLKAYTTAVDEEEKMPKVVLHGTPREESYMIEYDRYSSSYTVLEAGILLGTSEAISLLSCDRKYTSAKGGRAHGQFAAPYEDYAYVRGYIIYKNNTGAISVVYTDTKATRE